MAGDSSLTSLLSTLTQSLSSATESIPESSFVKHIPDGISLLDVKNELFLSYLQNLVFLILLKLRNQNNISNEHEDENFDEPVVKKLVELRVYFEKGVRPLEGRLKYQIDKVLRAAEDVARSSGQINVSKTSKSNGSANDESDSQGSEPDRDGREAESDVDEANAEIDDLQYRPNPSLLKRMPVKTLEAETGQENNGIYRPPRISATVMPAKGPREKEDRRPLKSATLDEFVSTELSSAPLVEPSIGSNIVYGGRRSKSEREKREEQERLEYEEKNYMRLPKEGKKERVKKNKERRDAGYGGEEWRDLGDGLDRIEKLTKRKSGGARNVLEKSRKRATEDGPRGDGTVQIGQGYQKRLKALDGKRRDRGRR